MYEPEDKTQEQEFEMNLLRLKMMLENASDFPCDGFKEAKREVEKEKERVEELERKSQEAVQARKEAENSARKAEEDRKRADAARERERKEERERSAQREKEFEQKQTQMAAMNHVREVTQAVSALDHNVKFQLTIENNTNHHLQISKFTPHSGYVSSAPKSVKPKVSGSMGGHKTSGSATGADGTVAWKIGTTGKMVVVMYSLPYSHDFHSNWCGVGIFNVQDSSGFFDRMYNRTETSFKRKDFWNNLNAVSYSGNNFRVTAKMGYEHNTHVKVIQFSFFIPLFRR
jgi:hypothetical protein